MTFIDIGEEFYIVAEQVIAVRKIDDGKCSLWLHGQSALEGFVVEKSARELVELICESCAEPDEEEDVEEYAE